MKLFASIFLYPSFGLANAQYYDFTVVLRSHTVSADAHPIQRRATLAKYAQTAASLTNTILHKYNADMQPALKDTSGAEVINLAKYYTVIGAQMRDLDSIMADLHAHDDVELAYIMPQPELPAPILQLNSTTQIPSDTNKSPDFIGLQNYLLSGSAGGIGARFAMNQPGGYGDGINVFDVEYSWNTQHEDLQSNFGGILSTPIKGRDDSHGTAVAGIIGGDVNDFGVQGIAPKATCHGSSIYFLEGDYVSVPKAIMAAADKASPGDVILIELQLRWRFKRTEEIYLPVEWFPLIYDVIRHTTDLGIVVVEAAGNGDGKANGIDLMDSALRESRLIPPRSTYPYDYISVNGQPLGSPNPFDPQSPNSGAVVVGAGWGGGGSSPDRSRLDFSNYGSRVDVQAQGNQVVSTGISSHCNLLKVDAGDNRCYTGSFSGTSSASAIIAGVVASVQGIVKAAGKKPLTSLQFQELFRDPRNGYPQTDGILYEYPASQNIGLRPDIELIMRNALAIADS